MNEEKETAAVEPAKTAPLKACSLFAGFTDTGLKIFAAVAVLKKLEKGAVLFKDGDVSDGLYVVADGVLAVMVKDPEGREVQLGLLGPGDHVGSAGLLGKSTRFATVLVHHDAVLLHISAEEFAKLQAQKPVACVKLMSAAAQELGKLLGEAGEVRQAIQEAAIRRLRAG
jgi:CRP-like cAMP-binding protein